MSIGKLRAILFYSVYSLSLLLFTPLCLVFGWFLPIRTRYQLFVLWNGFALWWVRICCGVSHEETGGGNLPKPPFVMVCNHQSPWETIYLYHRFTPLCAILKIELLRIPFFGWALWMLQPIAIDRSKRREARSTLLTEGGKRLANGISVLIFPEGTRVDPGQEHRFSAGAAELAIKNAVPIVPVAHNAGLYWPARRLEKIPGVIQFVIGDPIDTSGREPRELTAHLEQWNRSALARNSQVPGNP